MAITTSGKLRKVLVEAIERAAKGDMPQADGRNIIGLANQITLSMTAELKVRQMQVALNGAADAFGSVQICDT